MTSIYQFEWMLRWRYLIGQIIGLYKIYQNKIFFNLVLIYKLPYLTPDLYKLKIIRTYVYKLCEWKSKRELFFNFLLYIIKNSCDQLISFIKHQEKNKKDEIFGGNKLLYVSRLWLTSFNLLFATSQIINMITQ